MNESANVVRGILHPDGTMELAERPNMPAGDVEVTIRPVAKVVAGENWLEYLMRIRVEREADGYRFRTKEEIDAEMAEDRDWSEDRLDELRGQTGTEPPTPPAGPTEVANQPAMIEAPRETLWESMQRSRAELEESGYRFRTKEEIDADIEDMRDWDGKVDEVYRQIEEERRRLDPK